MATTKKSKAGAKKTAKKSVGSNKQAASKGRGQSSKTHTQQQPKSPMPAQHQEKPGIEAKITPKPEYEAPLYKGSGKLQDKIALITGGDSGIGRGVAVLFAREGADIAIVYLPEEQQDAEQTRQAVEREGRRALLIPGDVRDAGFCGA